MRAAITEPRKTRTTGDVVLAAMISLVVGAAVGAAWGKSGLIARQARLLKDLSDCRQQYHQHLDHSSQQLVAFERQTQEIGGKVRSILLQPLPPCEGRRR